MSKWRKVIISAKSLYDTNGMTENIKGYICNHCKEFSIARYNFCPNCGANMSPSVKQIVCSQCGGTRFVSHGEEVRCSNCGAHMRGNNG